MSIPPLPFKVKTKVSWAGEEEGDLGFIENEVIEVYSIVDDSWWSGRLRRNKAEGIFPKDYVKIIEQPMNSSMNASMNNSQMSNHSPMHSSHHRESHRESHRDNLRDSMHYHNSNPGTPTQTPKKHQLPSSKKYGYEKYDYDEFSFDNSYENLSKSVDPYRKKKHSNQDYNSSKQREIERFKMLQQQQNYHIKKAVELDQRKRMLTQDMRNIMPESPNSKKYTKMRPQSQYFDDHRQSSTPNLKSQEYQQRTPTHSPTYSPYGVFPNNTVESLSPESPSRKKYYQEDEIELKKKQLELEILQLEELQRSQRKPRSNQQTPVESPIQYRYKEEDSYVSEVSSKRTNELSNKMSKFTTDEELNIYEDDHRHISSSPPPPPPKHQSPSKYVDGDYQKIPYDADDFRFSGNKVILTEEEFMRLSQLQQQELRNSIKSLQSDVLNLSELSATSAGSFLRHKYEKEFQEVDYRMKGVSLNESTTFNGELTDDKTNVMDSIFQDKKSKHPNIFKKFMKKKEDLNPLEQKLQQEDEMGWAEFKSEMNRMNSLTSSDKQLRTKRVVREESHVVVKPFDYISDINTNETIGDVEELQFPQSFEKVDKFANRYDLNVDLNDLISDIGLKFHNSPIHQIRSVLIHFLKFNIIEENGKIQQIKPKLTEILHSGEGSIYQINYLFKKVLDALRVPCEMVLGFWKKPNEFYHNEQYIINHCWLSVLVNNQFFIVDIYNYKNGDSCNLAHYNEFYFLAKPLLLISTHLPSIIDLQHVIPPIDPNIAFYLPRLYSGYHKNGLNFCNFNNALTRLLDFEIFELDLAVPLDIELFALIKTSKITSNEFCLCQIYWKNNVRYAKIKAILPENENIGVLQIFSGKKGLQKYFNNIHELSIVIPIYHNGENKSGKFVPRFPTIQSQMNDLYVKSPQTSKIVVKNSYNFVISQYPSTGVTSNILPDFKVVIESPSGKYFKLINDEPKPYGDYESLIKCTELGTYRGLVIGDSGNSWYVFAQWECVPGVVNN